MSEEEWAKPWERQPDEPNRWFRHFESYLRSGPDRTLLGTYNLTRAEKGGERRAKTPRSWDRAFDQWQWKERAERYDDYLSGVQHDEWLIRFAEYRQKEWALIEKMLDKVEQMLEFPLAKVERETKALDGGIVAITNIYPARWTLRDAASILDVAAKLIAVRQGQKDDNDKPGQVINFDFNGFPPEILRAIAYGGDQASNGEIGAADTGAPESD